uniref:Uncharacterized protein n=1 Tax=Acrobeloides nanus TaxID=290746 RepID=A0A914D5L2_9BILA
KSLQSKMKRLKKLRNEVRLLVNQLKVDKRMKDEIIAIQLTPPSELKNGSLAKWKSRIRNRVRSILKRLEKLEKVMKIRKAEIREAKRKLNKSSHPKTTQMLLVPTRVVPTKVSSRRNRRTTTNPVVVHLVKSTIEPTGITINQMHVAFNQARNKSLSGDLGSQCNSHNECKPGLCCHKMKQRDGSTISECVRHAKKELDYCEHSCACMLGLHCFRETRGIGSILPKPAFCKKASPDDALNGIYENAKDRVFEDTKPL